MFLRRLHGKFTQPYIIYTPKKRFTEEYMASLHALYTIHGTEWFPGRIHGSHTHPCMLTVYHEEKDTNCLFFNIFAMYLTHGSERKRGHINTHLLKREREIYRKGRRSSIKRDWDQGLVKISRKHSWVFPILLFCA